MWGGWDSLKRQEEREISTIPIGPLYGKNEELNLSVGTEARLG